MPAPDLVTGLGEFGRAAHGDEIATRPRQRHGHDVVHLTPAHDDDAVGDQHGLVEVVGDEDDRLAGAGVEVEQFGLQRLARLRV